MSSFTPGNWWIAPPIFDGDVIFAPPQHEGRRNEVVATSITNRADARLIAAAPLMYKLLKDLTTIKAEPIRQMVLDTARRLIAILDEEEAQS